jgi:hypothetical protein
MRETKIVRVTCDRCGRDFPLDPITENRKGPAYLLRLDDRPVIQFDDLCSKCNEEVNNLLSEIADPGGGGPAPDEEKEGEHAAQPTQGSEEKTKTSEEPKGVKRPDGEKSTKDGYDF